MRYRRRASPLHAARASAGGLFCCALVVVAVLYDHPLILGVDLLAVLSVAIAAGVMRAVARTWRWAAPVAFLAAVVNPLFAHYGLTVLARLGELPPFGQIDLTLEALVYGAIVGLKLLVISSALAVLVVCIDPDELLRMARRLSFRSALTVTLGLRMWTILERDARRLGEAQRTRPASPARTLSSRAALVAAVAANALDRAVDAAATLELRGYASARRLPLARRPWSRHDLAFAAAAVLMLALAVVGRAQGAASFGYDPRLSAPLGPAETALAAGVLALGALPFANRRGIEP